MILIACSAWDQDSCQVPSFISSKRARHAKASDSEYENSLCKVTDAQVSVSASGPRWHPWSKPLPLPSFTLQWNHHCVHLGIRFKMFSCIYDWTKYQNSLINTVSHWVRDFTKTVNKDSIVQWLEFRLRPGRSWFKSLLWHGFFLGDSGSVTSIQPSLPHRVFVKKK